MNIVSIQVSRKGLCVGLNVSEFLNNRIALIYQKELAMVLVRLPFLKIIPLLSYLLVMCSFNSR